MLGMVVVMVMVEWQFCSGSDGGGRRTKDGVRKGTRGGGAGDGGVKMSFVVHVVV